MNPTTQTIAASIALGGIVFAFISFIGWWIVSRERREQKQRPHPPHDWVYLLAAIFGLALAVHVFAPVVWS